MTRDEDVIIEAKKYYRNDIKCYDAFLHGVEWVEEQIANVWHDANEKPRAKEWLLVQFGKDDYYTHYLNDLYIDMWCIWCKTYNVIRWAYISDLLKGGEK